MVSFRFVPFLQQRHTKCVCVCVCLYTTGYEWRGDLFDPFDWLEGQGDLSYRDPLEIKKKTRSISTRIKIRILKK